MGTGKTTVARALAIELKLNFCDLDSLIEEREKRSIQDIFREKGEGYFRDKEQAILREISSLSGTVVSCGGGIVTREENIERMTMTGTVICLSASAEAIIERTKNGTDRPLLNVADKLKTIQDLLFKRASCYARADARIDTTGLSVKEVVTRIVLFLSGHGNT